MSVKTYLFNLVFRGVSMPGMGGQYAPEYPGLHMNVMLGTFLVNHEKPEYVATKTWGLIFSGDKYGQINQALTNWMNY